VKRLKTRVQRVLLNREQVLDELRVGEDQLEDLIDADVLSVIQIRGHRRYDSDEVDQLDLRNLRSRLHRNDKRPRRTP